MKLNKNTAHTLLCILNGNTTAIKISEQLTNITVRSIQRALVDLTSGGLITRHGTNNPHYSINYNELLSAGIPDKLLENEQRPSSKLNHDLINYLGSQSTEDLESLFGNTKNVKIPTNNSRITAKELEYLTIELSWKSSALEGNTYTLLDTQLLLSEGIKAKNKTEFETQMILNHKNAIVFIVENKELFTNNIEFKSLEELHRIIGYNLGIDSGVRKKIVRISASNYEPLAGPHQLREYADAILSIINKASSPFAKALIALAFIPYLQIFDDGNKRTGRMLANALLINSIGRGFSLRKIEAKQLALAYLAFYEFNSISALSKILESELSA